MSQPPVARVRATVRVGRGQRDLAGGRTAGACWSRFDSGCGPPKKTLKGRIAASPREQATLQVRPRAAYRPRRRRLAWSGDGANDMPGSDGKAFKAASGCAVARCFASAVSCCIAARRDGPCVAQASQDRATPGRGLAQTEGNASPDARTALGTDRRVRGEARSRACRPLGDVACQVSVPAR